MSSIRHLYTIFPELFILLNSCWIILVGAFRKELKKILGIGLSWACLLVLVGSLILVLMLGKTHDETLFFIDTFRVDTFILFLKALILISGIMVLLFALTTFQKSLFYSFEFSLLLLFSILGMMVMVSARDFLVLFVGMELQALPLYILVAFFQTNRNTEASIKYFILGALATCLFLFGTSFFYGHTGTTHFNGINSDCLSAFFLHTEMILSAILILSAVSFKCSLAPFHMWTPDVYEGAPTPITFLLTTASKISALGVMVHLIYEPFSKIFSASLYSSPTYCLYGIAALSMIVSAFGGLAQTNLKRLAAYSTIGHMGFILAALSTQHSEGLLVISIYLFTYILAVLGLFSCFMIIIKNVKHDTPLNLTDLKDLFIKNPFLASIVTVCLFSLAGIPPLGGFFGKFLVFKLLIDKGLIWLSLIGIFSSLLSCFYYLRIIKIIYFEESSPTLSLKPLKTLAIQRIILFFIAFSLTFFVLVLPWLIQNPLK